MIDVEVPLSIRGRRQQQKSVSPRAEEIARQAIDLFNIHGASRFSVSRVAEQMNISPGNLHYHYRTNVALFLRLFEMLESDVRLAMEQVKMPMTFTNLIEQQVEIQRLLWRHRYFFRDLDFIVHIDEDIFKRFLGFQSWSIGEIVRHQELYRRHFGLCALKGPQTEIEIARNCWMMWTSWVRWEAIAGGETQMVDGALDKVIYRLTWNHFGHHLPHIEPETGVAVKAKLREMLGVN